MTDSCREATDTHMLYHDKQSRIVLELTKRCVAMERRIKNLEDCISGMTR